MKLILKNSKLVFAKNIQNLEVGIVPTQGEMFYWDSSSSAGDSIARETIYWDNNDPNGHKAITSQTKYQRSQVISIDRIKYNKFEIVTAANTTPPTKFWIVFAGESYSQILYQSGVLPNTEYDFRTSEISVVGMSPQTNTIDNHINSLHSGESVHQIGICLKNENDSSDPTMTASDFAKVKIIFKP